jgi:hypothetical protein
VGGVVKRFSIVAGICAISLAALAQSGGGLRDRDPDLEGAKKVVSDIQQANIHSGRFYMFSRLRISDAGFAEDVYLPTGGAEGGVNLSVQAPQRLYFVPHRKTVFTADFVPGYTFLTSGRRTGQFDYSARADAHFLFNHLYLDTYTLLSDQLRAQVADVNRLATQRDRESGVTGEMKYSSRTTAIFSGRYHDIRFPERRFQPLDVPVALLDRVERNGRISLHHKTFPLTSLFVAAEASTYGFRTATYKDSSRAYVGAGFLRASGRTSFRAEAGQTRLDFTDPAQRDYSGITGQASISRSLRRWSYTLGATRDVGFSIFRDNNYYIATGGRFAVDYSATRRLTLRASTTVERDDYDIPVDGLLRRDDLSFTTVGFMYAFRHMSFGIDGGWFQRESNFITDDSGIRWVLHLSFTP